MAFPPTPIEKRMHFVGQKRALEDGKPADCDHSHWMDVEEQLAVEEAGEYHCWCERLRCFEARELWGQNRPRLNVEDGGLEADAMLEADAKFETAAEIAVTDAEDDAAIAVVGWIAVDEVAVALEVPSNVVPEAVERNLVP